MPTHSFQEDIVDLVNGFYKSVLKASPFKQVEAESYVIIHKAYSLPEGDGDVKPNAELVKEVDYALSVAAKAIYSDREFLMKRAKTFWNVLGELKRQRKLGGFLGSLVSCINTLTQDYYTAKEAATTAGANMSIHELSRKLAIAGVKHVVVAVEGKIKVTTKLDFPKGLDHLIGDWHQDGNLRNRISISDPTKLKVTNWLTKEINNPDYWKHPLQKPGYVWTIRISQFGKGFGDPDVFKAKYTVALVDKATRKPIYTRDDITGNELELIEVKD